MRAQSSRLGWVAVLLALNVGCDEGDPPMKLGLDGGAGAGGTGGSRQDSGTDARGGDGAAGLTGAPDASTAGRAGTGGEGGAAVGGHAGASGGAGQAGNGGHAGQGGAAGECSDLSPCPPTGNECVLATCADGSCSAENAPSGTPSSNQTAGDCRISVCDGEGDLVEQDDASDVQSDGRECTTDLCIGGSPEHVPLAQGTLCDQAGGKVCNELGDCVECIDAMDCTTGVCQANQCAPASCTDDVLNGGETDVDCGGNCAPCADGASCQGNDDCQSGVCNVGVCRPPSCTDGVENGQESDVDCGGAACPTCGPGRGCVVNSDCAGSSCIASVCAPTCTDQVENGTETDVDCGGPVCPDCANGSACDTAADCASGFCHPTTSSCAAPSCTDQIENGSETDVDCGGPVCPTCGPGRGCIVDTDCAGSSCSAGVCAPTCTDQVENGAEADVDCGGPVCPGCVNGDACAVDGDCVSRLCYAGVCVGSVNGCAAATATDLTGQSVVTIAFPNNNLSYAPKCTRVTVGTVVTFLGPFSSHPLQGGQVIGGTEVPATSGPFVPATTSGSFAQFTMATTGAFPFYCIPHGTTGMNGAVFVVP